MNTFSIDEILQSIRQYQHRGDYQVAAAFVDRLPTAVLKVPKIALERGRNRLRQGRINDAVEAFSHVDFGETTSGEQLILALEQASLSIYRELKIHQSLQTAKSALEQFREQVNAVEWAEAKRIHIRLLMIAAVYREVSVEDVYNERENLPQIADTLQDAEYLDESLAARFTYAEKLLDRQAAQSALRTVADQALELGYSHVSGAAHLRRAELLLAVGAAQGDITEALEHSEQYYTSNQHVHGLIDVQRVRAKLGIAQQVQGPEVLEDCLKAYRAIGLSKSVISLLMDLSQLALENGDVPAAAAYRQESLALVEETGDGADFR